MKKSTILISCNVLKPQIDLFKYNSIDYLYLKQGLHMTPDLLRTELQQSINGSKNYERILLGYGLCSRAVIGLQAQQNQTLVIPKIDDCIGISMGSRDKYYREFSDHPGTYYFTKGWAEADGDPLKEYYLTVDKYGEELARWAAQESLKHYTRTCLIRTENEELDSITQYVQEFARFFSLRYEEMEGSLHYLEKLVYGPWDHDDFVMVSNGEIIEDRHFKVSQKN